MLLYRYRGSVTYRRVNYPFFTSRVPLEPFYNNHRIIQHGLVCGYVKNKNLRLQGINVSKTQVIFIIFQLELLTFEIM